jgi:broad specificity phosphatase PhoE
MSLPTVMFIRHAEKPDKDHKGVTPDGEHDEHSLSVRGWTRAGALAALFAEQTSRSGLTTPARIIATAPSHSYKSKREHDTALPTAQRLDLSIEATTIPDDYAELIADIKGAGHPALVVWHHGSIPEFIAGFEVSNAPDIPHKWPEERFDLVWVLSPKDDSYTWAAVPQRLLRGDD